jgi:hypothetical protein
MQQTPSQRRTINRLREVVMNAIPELEERMRWHQVGYLISNKDVRGI